MVVRKYPRFPVAFRTAVIYQKQSEHTGTVRDLSLKGCRVESAIPAFTGMQLLLRLHVPEEPTPILVDNAAVRWAGSLGLGLEFLTIAPPQLKRLSRIIQHLAKSQATAE